MSLTQSDVELLSKLAEQYRDKGNTNPRQNWADILKAHTLYNACASRSSAKKWGERAFEVQKTYWGDKVSSTLKEQTEIARDFQAQLYTIREECKDNMFPVTHLINRWDCNTDNLDSADNKKITVQLTNRMKTISLAGNTRIKVFAGKLIQRSVELCRKPVPCKFATVALGSLAKGEATPYSDLEFMFLLEKKTPEIVEYFETLAMTAYFLIGNLRETKLKYMNIVELKKFTDKGKNGFKIDGLQAKAGNIPTGNGTEEQKNKFILTVNELLDKYQHIFLNPDPEESKKGDFTSMLAHTTVIYGEPSLLSEFERGKRKHMIEVNDSRINAHNSMIQQDVKDYDFMPLNRLTFNSHRENLKSAIYRFPSLLTYNLKIINNIDSKTSWETLDKLFQMRKLSQSFYVSLQFLLASALYIRMAAYLHHNSQNDDMIFVSSLNPSNEFRFWHIPNPLHLHMSLHMIPVKHTIAESSDPLYAVTTDIVYDTNVVSAHVNYHAGNYVDASKVLEKLIIKNYEELTMLLLCYLKLGQWNKYQPAVKNVIDYIKARPHNLLLSIMLPYYKYKSATGYAQSGDLASAKKGFEEVLGDLTPHYYNHEIYAHASSLYSRICDEDRAKHYYEKACKHLEESAPTMNQTFYYDTFRSEMLHNRAARLIGSSHFTEAEPLILETIEIKKRMYGESGISVNLADSYHALGNVYNGLGQNTKALEYQRKAEELYNTIDPLRSKINLSNHYCSFALTYEAQGDLDKALDYYRKALVQVKKYHTHSHQKVADLERRIGFLLSSKEEYVEAERHFKRSLSIYDTLDNSLFENAVSRCYMDFGVLRQRQNRHPESLVHLYKAVSFRFNDDDNIHQDTLSEAWARIGQNLMSQGEYEKAASSFEKSESLCHFYSAIDIGFRVKNYCYLGQCYIDSTMGKQAWDRMVAHIKAHKTYIRGISFLVSKPSIADDYSLYFLMLAVNMFIDWTMLRRIVSQARET